MQSHFPEPLGVVPPEDVAGFIFWMDEIDNEWDEALGQLTLAFHGSRAAAQASESIVYIVRNDDLLGRNGPAPAMVAAGLLSAARTAALEGFSKGWTANVIAYDSDVDPSDVVNRAVFVLSNGITTGEVIHMGPGHIGKALV